MSCLSLGLSITVASVLGTLLNDFLDQFSGKPAAIQWATLWRVPCDNKVKKATSELPGKN